MEFNSRRRQFLQAVGAMTAIGIASQPVQAADDDTYWEVDSDYFATAFADYHGNVDTSSDGDLWPSCWADDGYMYTSNGDGVGFGSGQAADIVMNRMDGTPKTGISGTYLAEGDELGNIWADPDLYNRKPTGMAAVDGNGDGNDELYLAYQDLRHSPDGKAFDDAPNASISKSTDYGQTWQKTSSAMFTDYNFTTIMFLDFGQSHSNESVLASENQGYLYAYGLDNNWRCSYSDTVPDPVNVYLARVPQSSVMDRSTWEFFTGTDSNGNPTWDSSISNRVAVLHDDRYVYQNQFTTDNPNNGEPVSVISQGGVVYNAPLDRYIYSSWTEYTFEFYEAPEPWGPWELFYRKDYGTLPWFGKGATCDGPKNGGYAATIPSKFISDDGKSMWVQANWFENVVCGANNYNYDLRTFDVTTYSSTTPSNSRSSTDNLATKNGAVTIEKSAHYGNGPYYNDGDKSHSEDSWDGTHKPYDFWGYTWPQEFNVNRVEYTTGNMFSDGGWFANQGEGLHVQVRQNFDWIDVTGLSISPSYPYDSSAGPNNTYTMTFDDDHGDGIRIIGVPGGTASFTSIGELEVYYD